MKLEDLHQFKRRRADRPKMKFVAHSETSWKAAEQIQATAETKRGKVFRALRDAGLRGLTDHEMQAMLPMKESTQRPRRVELCDMGLVVDSGRKRASPADKDAVVWIIASFDPMGVYRSRKRKRRRSVLQQLELPLY